MDRLTEIDKILPLVAKPTRYLGNEVNSMHKDHRNCKVKMALAFPDVYEIGMSHLGLKILYKILNDLPGVVAERVYTPWNDLAALMKKEGIALFSLEGRIPLRNFDIIGFSLQHELSYTNVLWMLELAGIPIQQRERNGDDPLIIAGGPCAANPEPMSEFIDLFCIGDGEGFVVDLVHSFIENRDCRKEELLTRLAQIPGAYVPSLYEVDQDKGGRFKRLLPKSARVPYPVQRRLEENLDILDFPTQQIIPFMEIVHDRATLEIHRGCTQGCRFCQAGMTCRPVRERSLRNLMDQTRGVIDKTGYEEISFMSLSITDYTKIEGLISWFIREFGDRKIAVSLPSLRVDSLATNLADLISKIKKTGLTLAPEAGTPRLRRVINKKFHEEDLFEAVEACFRAGWNLVKLYFMIGLPTENEEDIDGIVELASRMKPLAGRQRKIKVAISPFVPKPHTPFQWEGQLDLQRLRERMGYLKRRLRESKWIDLSWHRVEVSFLEAVFARGDRRLGEVLISAIKRGCRFDSWTDEFRFDLWEEAFRETGIDPCFYANRRIPFSEGLPWEHINMGITKEYLVEECKMAHQEQTSPDCREGECRGCGACIMREEGGGRREEGAEGRGQRAEGRDEKRGDRLSVIGDQLSGIERQKTDVRNQKTEKKEYRDTGKEKRIDIYPQRRVKRFSPNQKFRVRFEFTKGQEVRFLSHLDTMRTFNRTIRRTNIPVAFSAGYSPHPRLSFGPALRVGVTSSSEYADIELNWPIKIENLKAAFNKNLPTGITIQRACLVSPRAKSLSSIIDFNTYRIKIRPEKPLVLDEAIKTFLGKESIWSLRNDKRVDVRRSTLNIRIANQMGRGIFELEITLSLHGKSARVDEVIKTLLPLCEILDIERTGQYHLRGRELISPMEIRI